MSSKQKREIGPDPRERKFVRAFLLGMGKREAAIEAGYPEASAHQRATEILSRPHVKELLQSVYHREEQEVLTARAVIERQLFQMATTDAAAQIFDDDWGLRPKSEVPESVTRMVISCRTWDSPEQGRGGSVKLINRLDAMKAYLKLFPAPQSQAESLEEAAAQVEADIEALIAKFEAEDPVTEDGA
jgi:hypothetical protein